MPKKEYVVLDNPTSHAEFIISAIKKGQINKLQMSSFGFWAGVLADGRETSSNNISALLDCATENDIKTELVIGVAPFSSKAGYKLPPCLFCAEAHKRMFERLAQSRKRWPEILWYYHTNSHTKLSIGYKNKDVQWVITGGHNLTDSSLQDFSIVLQGTSEPFPTIFDNLRKEAEPDTGNMRIEFEEVFKAAKIPIVLTPSAEKDIPPVEDVIRFLRALAKKEYLPRDEFTRLAKATAWLIDQKNKSLLPAAKEAYPNNEELQIALRAYQEN